MLNTATSATNITYVAPGSRTAAEVAAGLAALIDALPDYAASADGAQVLIANLVGTAFTAGNYAVTDAVSATTTKVGFGGTALTNEKWTLTVAGEAQQLTVGTTYPSKSALAIGFAAWINGNAALADFTAVVEGEELLIVKRTTGSFATTVAVAAAGTATPALTTPAAGQVFTVGLSGTPAAGETWSVTLGGQTVSATVGASANNTLAKIAETLAAAIRAHASLSGFTAAAKGTNLVIVEESTSAAAAPVLSVTPAGSIAAAAAPSAYLVELSG